MLSKIEFINDTTSYALNELDIKLKKYLDYPNGVFIEAGANDGVTQSNTKIFADLFGWKGLLVEPDVKTYNKCRKNRPESIVVNGALVSFNYKQKHIHGDFNGSLTASVKGMRQARYINNDKTNSKLLKFIKIIQYKLTKANFRVPVYTLDSLIRKYNLHKIDLLSLDVEGYELEVLLGIDYNNVYPEFILCEIYVDKYEDIKCFLESKGYELIDNLSKYNTRDFPNWDGSHNDYLFRKSSKTDR